MSSLFGKIFVLGIFIMSIVFMSLAMAVYSTHTNWKTVVERQQASLQTATTANDQLTEQSERLQSELASATTAHQQQLAKLETEQVTWERRRQEMQLELTERSQQVRTLSASVDSTQQNLTRLVLEVEALREQVRLAQVERDQKFNAAVAMTDDLGQALVELERSEVRQAQLLQQIATYKRNLTENDINPDALPADQAPPVDGFVTAVRRNDLIEVSIGSDDGLYPGHTMHVFRGKTYLGRAEVLQSAPDRAVGKLLKAYKKGSVKKGDRVATRLKIS